MGSELLHANGNGTEFLLQDSTRESMNIVPVVAAVLIAGAAYALRLLTRGGAVVAAMIGAASIIAGVQWVIALLFFFVTSNVLSRWRRRDRDRLVGGIVEKGDRRDAMQVIANGGVFGVAAVLATVGDHVSWQHIGIGALATATSDTWSTEVGTVLGDTPRSLWTGEPVPAGTSGGITIAGLVAALVGALAVGALASMLDWSTPWQAIAAGALAGSALDSLLGATVQERRWCPSCHAGTERRVHTCGTKSVDRGGVSGCNNDIVNLISTIAGAGVTWIVA